MSDVGPHETQYMHSLEVSQTRKLEALFRRRPVFGRCGQVERFVLQYIFLEAVVRVVLAAYRKRPAAKAHSGKNDFNIRKDVVTRSFVYYGVNFASREVDRLLDARSINQGSKSARKLRDALVHEWRAEDAEEVNVRSSELALLIESAVQAIEASAFGRP